MVSNEFIMAPTVALGLEDALHEARITVQQQYNTSWYGVGLAAIGLSVTIGAIIVIVFLYWCFNRLCFPHTYSDRLVAAGYQDGNKRFTHFVEEKRRAYRPYIRVVLSTFFLIGIYFGIKMGLVITGYNYASSPVNNLTLSLIATYMFSSAITNFGAGYWNNMGDRFEHGDWLTIPSQGPMCKGYLEKKGALHSELHHLNERGFHVKAIVPHTVMSNSVVLEELEYLVPDEDGGKLQRWYREKHHVKYDKIKQLQKSSVTKALVSGEVVIQIDDDSEPRKDK